MAIRSESELGAALQREQDTIEIEGDLVRKVVRIRATGKVAWAIAFGAIGISVMIVLGSGGTGAPAAGFVGVSAVSILGMGAATSAVAIAVAARSASALNQLRQYKVVSSTGDSLVLSRR